MSIPPAQDPIQYAHPATAPRTSTFSIVSLVCGCLLCVPFVPGVLAGVFGFLGLRQSRDPNYSGKGMAIAGLVLGILNVLGWTAYFIVVVALVVPAMNQVRTAAVQVVCNAQMRQIHTALTMYADENKGAFPPNLAGLSNLKSSQVPQGLTFNCPSPSSGTGSGAPYVYVGAGKTKHSPQQTILLYEPLSNHTSGANFLYASGIVQFHTASAAQRLIRELEAGHNPPRGAAAPATDSSD
jgi:hypothetical protein